MYKKQRGVTWVVSAALFLVMLCSCLYIIKEASHSCTGDNCPICAQISEAENNLKKLANSNPPVKPAAVFVIPCSVLYKAVEIICFALLYSTLVAQKIRMNN